MTERELIQQQQELGDSRPDMLFDRTCPCRFITLIRIIDNHIRIICTNRN